MVPPVRRGWCGAVGVLSTSMDQRGRFDARAVVADLELHRHGIRRRRQVETLRGREHCIPSPPERRDDDLQRIALDNTREAVVPNRSRWNEPAGIVVVYDSTWSVTSSVSGSMPSLPAPS